MCREHHFVQRHDILSHRETAKFPRKVEVPVAVSIAWMIYLSNLITMQV